jgi:hypothetical protein
MKYNYCLGEYVDGAAAMAEIVTVIRELVLAQLKATDCFIHWQQLASKHI